MEEECQETYGTHVPTPQTLCWRGDCFHLLLCQESFRVETRLSDTVQQQDWAREEVQRWIIQLLVWGEEQQQILRLQRHDPSWTFSDFFSMPWITQIYVTKSQFINRSLNIASKSWNRWWPAPVRQSWLSANAPSLCWCCSLKLSSVKQFGRMV